MLKAKQLPPAGCRGLTPRMFAVNHGAGEKLPPQILAWLDPVQPETFHFWELGKDKMPELHYHDFDEYWVWTKGSTVLTLRLPDGQKEAFEVGPGWIMYLVRGVEHCHIPKEDWACYEFHGTYRPGCSMAHLHRDL